MNKPLPKLNLPCRFSKEAQETLRLRAGKIQLKGIVIRETKDKSRFLVLWEGNKALIEYPKKFIEIIKKEDNKINLHESKI